MFTRFKFHFLVLAALALLFVACSSTPHKHDFPFERLTGEWSIVEGAKTHIESWQVRDEGYAGTGVILNSTDTTFVEELLIYKRGSSWIYQAKASGQNDNQPIDFIQENETATTIAFANYKHDFPQRIVYEFISENELQVYIEGPRDGEKIRIVMDFKRTTKQ